LKFFLVFFFFFFFSLSFSIFQIHDLVYWMLWLRCDLSCDSHPHDLQLIVVFASHPSTVFNIWISQCRDPLSPYCDALWTSRRIFNRNVNYSIKQTSYSPWRSGCVLPVKYEHHLHINSKAIPVKGNWGPCFLWGTNIIYT
jgi:hypothetical protein